MEICLKSREIVCTFERSQFLEIRDEREATLAPLAALKDVTSEIVFFDNFCIGGFEYWKKKKKKKLELIR